MQDIKEVMLNLTKRINQKCNEPGNNGEEIFFLAAALKEVESVRATLPKEFLDTYSFVTSSTNAL